MTDQTAKQNGTGNGATVNGSENGNGHGEDLGLAGRLAKAFINSPLSPLLLIACFALGLMGIVVTPRQEDPQISVPMVDVMFQYPGISAEQVASLATDPLERLMSEIPGVEHVYSTSERNGAMVTVQFEVGEEMGPSLVKLNDKIQSNLDKIPPGVSQPLIKPKGVDDVPVVTLTLWSHTVDEGALRSLSLDVMQRLKEVPNTSQSFVVGGRSDAIKVEVFPERLAGFGIGLDEIAQTINAANSERGVGMVEAGTSSFTLYTGSFLRNARDIENLMIGVSHGQPTYIRDVALVTQGTDDATSMVSYYTGPAYGHHAEHGEAGEGGDHGEIELAPLGAPAVTIAVAKKSGSNGVSVANAVLASVERLKGSLIPDNVHVEITRNYGETANEKVNELIFKLFVVTGAVTLLIWLALGVRAAIVVLIVIPIVILMTVFSAWILGFTIDRVSLFALIFSIGILVDDAIVVVENIYRRWLEDGEVSEAVSVDAVREVGNPTILATFTVIAALLPMGFVRGMMGPYMAPIPALGSVAMLFSLFAAFLFTPWLAQRIRPSMASLEKSQESEHRQTLWLNRFFVKTLVPLIHKRVAGWSFLIGLVVVFFLSLFLFYTQSVTVKMLPKDNKPEFNVTINMPEGTPLPVTANVASRLSEKLMDIPEVVALQSYVGTASPFNFNGLVRHTYLRNRPWMADIQVEIGLKHHRDRSSEDLAVVVREMLTPLAREMGARIEVIEMPPGPPVLQTMVAEVYGPDAETRRQVARDIRDMFDAAEITVDADALMQDSYSSWRFVVDREKASRRGVSVETINRQLEMAMGGYILGDVKNDRAVEPTYIYLQMPLSLRGQFGRLGQLPVPSATGAMIPLTELGSFEEFRLDDPIFHKNLRAVEFVTADVTGALGAPIYAIFEIEDMLDGYTAPDGVRVETNYLGPPDVSMKSALEWTGEWTVTYETFRDMGLAYGVALLLIYVLVVWEFGNFTIPAIVMAPIPLTLIGIVPGHWMFGASFTATSMIGFIALAGIIVRNSILLVDFSLHAVKTGMRVQDAVIYSCQTRTRPIIITALALIAGSSVILSDPIFQGMAISLMFGGLVSTLLTLIVIPLGCVTWSKALLASIDGPVDPAAGQVPEMPKPQGPDDGPGGPTTGGGIARSLGKVSAAASGLVARVASGWARVRAPRAEVTAAGPAAEPAGESIAEALAAVEPAVARADAVVGEEPEARAEDAPTEAKSAAAAVQAKPAARPKARPAAKQAAEPVAKPKAPATKPKARPAAKPKPAASPVAKTKPAARPKPAKTPKAGPVAKPKPAAKPKAGPEAPAKAEAGAAPSAKPKARPAPAATPKAKAKPAVKPRRAPAKPSARANPAPKPAAQTGPAKPAAARGGRRGIRLKGLEDSADE
ncbi:MAG: acriflavin resistance protein [Rhodobacterales bacterium]|nr:MAG: acriflavin resistance protein [Rhodobacterales bacterium]